MLHQKKSFIRAVRFSRQRTSNARAVMKEKIDGIVAAIMALDRCIRNQTEPQGSVYDDRGLLIL